jgi:hypothetical protein
MELGEFQTASLAIALVILVISLIGIGISLGKTSGKYPPTIDACPDYWSTSNYLSADVSKCNKTEFGCCSDYATPKEDADGSNCPVKCYNTHQLGKVSSTCTSKPTEMDFSDDVYTGSAGLCNKQKWASQCGITWDGVTDVANAC